MWNYATGGEVASSPAIDYGAVYVGSYDHIVYAFGSSPDEPASSESLPVVAIAVLTVIVLAVAMLAAAVWYRAKVSHKMRFKSNPAE